MFHWELDEQPEVEFAGLTQFARRALAELMDAVVLVDPADYQRRACGWLAVGAAIVCHGFCRPSSVVAVAVVICLVGTAAVVGLFSEELLTLRRRRWRDTEAEVHGMIDVSRP